MSEHSQTHISAVKKDKEEGSEGERGERKKEGRHLFSEFWPKTNRDSRESDAIPQPNLITLSLCSSFFILFHELGYAKVL